MGGINLDQRLLRSAFTEQRYSEIRRFVTKVWKNKAKYKVLMARRAFNLNYAFMEAGYVQSDDEFITENIMSNTALLLCAEELSEYYRWVKQFPQILIADDLLLHGRSIKKLLNNLEALIIEFLDEKGIKEDKAAIHEELLRAVTIYVFARNKKDLLLDPGYVVKSEQQVPMHELRGLSQQISDALQLCGIANTSYVLSTAMPAYLSRKLDYSSDLPEPSSLFHYRGYSQLYYYKFDNNLLKSIRANIPANRVQENGFNRLFTSLVIFGNISVDDFNKLCRSIAIQMDAIMPNSRITEILRYGNERLARPKAQLVSFLLSVECFAEFYREMFSTDGQELYSIFLKSDYRKIASNFGGASSTLRYEFMRLFKHVCFTETLLEYSISKQLGEYVQSICGMEEYIPSIYFEQGSVANAEENTLLYETAEDIFYEVGINAECAAANYKPEKENSSSFGSDVLQLSQYLSIMNRTTNSIKSMACILALMDSGLLSMNIEENRRNIQCVLKSGELAMYVLPRRFSVFMPALAIVEKYAEKRDLNIKTTIGRFIDYLQDYCYERGKSRKKDHELLIKLKESKGTLLYTYESEQRFQDWDTELLTRGDRVDSIEKQYGRYRPNRYQAELWEENAKKRHYAYCAKAFIQSEW